MGQPSPAQIEAGNYRKDHIRFRGLDITIESPAGSVRKGTDRTGKSWSIKMRNAYGYVRGSTGADGEHVDCYLGPDQDADTVYVVHQRQVGNWDKYDEDKAMLGFASEQAAKAAFLAHYTDPRFLGPITAMPFDEFKTKVLATKGKPKMIKALFLKAHNKGYTYTRGSKTVTVSPFDDKRTAGAKGDDKTADMFGAAPVMSEPTMMPHNPVIASVMASSGLGDKAHIQAAIGKASDAELREAVEWVYSPKAPTWAHDVAGDAIVAERKSRLAPGGPMALLFGKDALRGVAPRKS